MSDMNIGDIGTFIGSISALVLAIISIYKVFHIESRLRNEKISFFKDEKKEKTINDLGELVSEIQKLRHKIYKIKSGFRENTVEECKKEIKESRDKIHIKYTEILKHGFIESIINPNSDSPLSYSKEVHNAKNNAMLAAEKIYSELEKERVVSIADISPGCLELAEKAHKELREQRGELSNVQLQLITMFGISI